MRTATIPAAAAAFTLFLPSLFAQDQTIIQTTASTSSAKSQTWTQVRQWRDQFGDPKAHTEILATQESWLKLWKRLGSQPPQALNEKTQVGICVFIGQHSTTGYKPYIISAIERDGKMVVSYSTGQPGPLDEVTQDNTQPWVAALIPKTDLPIVFKEI